MCGTQPYSKFNPDFTRSTLRRILAGAGVSYVFLGESLGGRPPDDSCFVAGKLDAARCEEESLVSTGASRD